MNAVIFKNDGIIDPRMIKTFGISVKETDNPIGYFGTGLKYAIAVLLRNGCDVELISDGERFTFTKETDTVRGKEFEFISMNGHHLPFTTELGKNWVLWQAFRELYCNCIDEGGTTTPGTGAEPEKGKTIFVVKGQAFLNEYYDRHKYFLNLRPSECAFTDDRIQIYDKPSDGIFYRGIRVMDLPLKSQFTYNILETMLLTEDRTISSAYVAKTFISLGISRMTNKKAIKRIILDKMSFESDLDFDLNYDITPTDEFHDALTEEYAKNNDLFNHTALRYYTKKFRKESHKNYERHDLTEVQTKQLARALAVCWQSFPDMREYEFMVVKSLGQGTMALADQHKNKMIISAKCFDFGTKYLVSTLIEEYMHLKTGYADMTRTLQTHLFDTIAGLIEQHVIKEPI